MKTETKIIRRDGTRGLKVSLTREIKSMELEEGSEVKVTATRNRIVIEKVKVAD